MNESRVLLAIVLALFLVFSLTGISYYFPSSKDKLFEYVDEAELPLLPTSLVDGEQPQQPIYSLYVSTDLPNITIKDNGTIEPQDASIQRVGDIYTLTGDIVNYTLRIQRDNIVVDGDGYTIQGALNSPEGIALENRSNVILKNFEVTKFRNGISAKNCSNILITKNKLTRITSRALMIESCNNTVISGNVVDNTGIASKTTLAITFKSEGLVKQETGEYINHSDGFVTHKITTYTHGITVDGTSNTITENSLTNVGISIETRGNQVTLSKNNMVNGSKGIYITGSYCTVYGNNIANFSESGITVNFGTRNNIHENNVSDSKHAIILGNSADQFVIENNTVYHNNFVNNNQTFQVESLSHQNYWDNGSEGNYWSDYNGTDDNGDGIGDTLYVIDENNIDRFPLMAPFEPEQEKNMLFVYLGVIGLVTFAVIVATIMLGNRGKRLTTQTE